MITLKIELEDVTEAFTYLSVLRTMQQQIKNMRPPEATGSAVTFTPTTGNLSPTPTTEAAPEPKKEEPPKKKRGRPKGSKTKKKPSTELVKKSGEPLYPEEALPTEEAVTPADAETVTVAFDPTDHSIENVTVITRGFAERNGSPALFEKLTANNIERVTALEGDALTAMLRELNDG